jgi:hypothetical protein
MSGHSDYLSGEISECRKIRFYSTRQDRGEASE